VQILDGEAAGADDPRNLFHARFAARHLTWFATVREHCSMAKDKQKKHQSAEEKAASGKMKRKEFEKELAKLQGELVGLQTWVRAKHAR
jgi:polyphosphate kinase 2 (PPK2 family)